MKPHQNTLELKEEIRDKGLKGFKVSFFTVPDCIFLLGSWNQANK